MTGGRILVVNAGSSSIKVAVFDADEAEVLRGSVSGIAGERPELRIGKLPREVAARDHLAALAEIFGALAAAGIEVSGLAAAAHRVVHGGPDLTAPAAVTPAVLAEIEACARLAPLHNPHNLTGIQGVARLAPGLPQFASFDTAFHATNPEVATAYALPPVPGCEDLRRFGFHGISYAGLVEELPRLTGEALPERLLAFHLGNGCSICAIVRGASVATTMGYSPVSGLVMSTRAGPVDPDAVLRLARAVGIDEASRMMNHESGLRALAGGEWAMEALLARDDRAARRAVDHFVYWALRHAGSLIAAMGGVDAVAFSGGIGENAAPIRARIAEGLAWTGLSLDAGANAAAVDRIAAAASAVSAWIVPAREEQMIARDARRLLERGTVDAEVAAARLP